MADGQIVFEVTADGRRAIADIQDITREIQTETRRWDAAAEQSADNIGNSFSGMLKKLVAGFSAAKIGKALLDIGKEAIQAASDLEEVQNVVDVTFGANANQVETWAKKAGTQFGLTETQAKKFSSTMGAMLKSSGLAGDQIVNVSTDLAGLAADMASFYNLDFEEAFTKIRSGMSGMAMPLKELGIDMSETALQAFAMQKGLEKNFSQMSQSEKTMLRYQYLMQATADAQGDFARTSDGYANGVRMLETNLTSLKTNLGSVLLDVINPLLQGINSLFPEDGGDKHSILDDLAEIQINKDTKIKEIEAIKSVADELITTLEELGADTTGATVLQTLADGANSLSADSPKTWEAMLKTLTQVDGLENLFGDEDASENITALAEALSGSSVDTSKADAWKTFLGALSENADAVSKLTGSSVEETKKWLEGLAASAEKLNPKDAEAWNTLMGALLSGIGVGKTEEGQQFIETLAQNFLALGNDSEEAVSGLRALGYGTDEIEQKQATWLKTCKELVKQIPGLSSLIDTNTGEIKGGIPALREYADEWERTAKYQAEIEAIRSARAMYEANNNQSDLQAEYTTQKAIAVGKLKNLGYADARERMDALETIIQRYIDFAYAEGLQPTFENIRNAINPKTLLGDLDTVSGATANIGVSFLERAGIDAKQLDWYASLTGDAEEAMVSYAESLYTALALEKERPVVLEEIDAMEQEAADAYNVSKEELEAQAEAANAAAAAMTTLEKAANGDTDAMAIVTNAVEKANEALKELTEYVDGVYKETDSAIQSTLKGFEFIGSAAQRQEKRLKPLEKELETLKKNGKDLGDINIRISDAKDQYGVGTLKKNLDSQLAFLNEYKQDMEKARELGYSNEFLAQFSDGSVDSAEWLHELANSTGEDAKKINAAYSDVEESRKELAETLTGQKLTVDETYQTLAEKAKEAVAELDLEKEAADNTGKTIQGIAEGIKEHLPEVADQVDAIINELDRLNGWGINIDFGGFGSISFTTSTGKDADASGRFGLDYVPRDDYLIRAHEGERLLTAQENQIWNALLNGGVAGFDLDSLGGVMRDNIKPGGDVYLDGRVVGSVISDRQGRSYKSLQRSGWQG